MVLHVSVREVIIRTSHASHVMLFVKLVMVLIVITVYLVIF
jgi:hypothetical protein